MAIGKYGNVVDTLVDQTSNSGHIKIEPIPLLHPQCIVKTVLKIVHPVFEIILKIQFFS